MQTCANKLEALRTPPARASTSGMRHSPPRLFRTAARGHCPLALRLSQGVSIVVVVPHPRRGLRTRCNRARRATEQARAHGGAGCARAEQRPRLAARGARSLRCRRAALEVVFALRASAAVARRVLVPATATLAARNVERAPPSLPKQCTLALCTSNLPCNIIKSSSSA